MPVLSGPAPLRPLLLLGPLLLFLALTYLVPFAGVVGWSVTLPESGLGQYRTAFADPLVRSVAVRTLRVCATVTLCAVVAGYAIALVWVRGGPLQRLAAELCILIPFWISVLTRAFGWLALLSNRGLVNGWLQSLGLLAEPLTMVRNEFGVVVGMTHFLVPFAVFPIASALRGVDERTLLAARGMGASRSRTFLRVLLPMTAGGVAGAALLVFVFALGFFVTPALLGGGRTVLLAELVYLRVFQIPDWGLAAAIGTLVMLAVSALLALAMRWIVPREAR